MSEAAEIDGLQFAGPGDMSDLATFLGRAERLDGAALVRLRGGPGRVTAYLRVPFGVLVSRSARVRAAPADCTVRAGELAAALAVADRTGRVRLPVARDVEWRGALPPDRGWERVETVPAEVVDGLVRAGAEALRAVPAGAPGAGDTLLDHESLTITNAGHTVPIPLRVLSAVWRMGFLGAAPTGAAEVVVVSVSGRWTRVAAAYGSAYHRRFPPGGGLRLH